MAGKKADLAVLADWAVLADTVANAVAEKAAVLATAAADKDRRWHR